MARPLDELPPLQSPLRHLRPPLPLLLPLGCLEQRSARALEAWRRVLASVALTFGRHEALEEELEDVELPDVAVLLPRLIRVRVLRSPRLVCRAWEALLWARPLRLVVLVPRWLTPLQLPCADEVAVSARDTVTWAWAFRCLLSLRLLDARLCRWGLVCSFLA